eukprot:1595301-Alexandrium_andersonii.AAC.1
MLHTQQDPACEQMLPAEVCAYTDGGATCCNRARYAAAAPSQGIVNADVLRSSTRAAHEPDMP